MSPYITGTSKTHRRDGSHDVVAHLTRGPMAPKSARGTRVPLISGPCFAKRQTGAGMTTFCAATACAKQVHSQINRAGTISRLGHVIF